MTHHEMKKEEMKKEEKKTGTSEGMPEYETKMKERGKEIQEGRKREKEAEAGAQPTKTK